MNVITVNGREHEVEDALLDKKLLMYLRDDLELTGTKNGCNKGACGSCTVLVDNVATIFGQQDSFYVIITPEGTRSLNTNWKRGFYYIAKQANVPIALGYLDYKKYYK